MIIKDKAIEPYQIRVETDSYTLIKRGRGKNKEGVEIDTEFTVGYFKNLDSALHKLIKSKLSDIKQTATIKEYINVYRHLLKQFNLIFKDIL